MTGNQRGAVRTPLSANVKISHPEFGERIVETRNISDTGLFIFVDPSEMPPVGEVISGQVQGLEDAPVVKMKIVRTDEEGLGLQFIEP